MESVLRAAAAVSCAALLLASPAHAFSLKQLNIKRKYERQLIRWALDRKGLEIDERPAGKQIDRIEIVREDIIAKTDPWPSFLNIFHVKTRDYIVRQELLLRPGQRYDAALAAESERNLRRLVILAVARVVPCKSRRPGKVTLLVVTKDLWSIRLNMKYDQTGALVKVIDFTPTEENFLGRNKRLSLHLRFSQLELWAPVPYPLTLFTIGKRLRDHVAFGVAYLDHRLLGTRLRLLGQFDAYFDGRLPCGGAIDDSGGIAWCPETEVGSFGGVYARVRFDRPLFSLATEWGFHIDASLDIRQRRLFVQNSAGIPPPGQVAGVSLATRVYEPTDGLRQHVPFVYDGRRLISSAGFTRSFGRRTKHDLSWGALAYQLKYAAPDNFPFAKETKRWFVDAVLPRSESVAAFYVSYSTRPTRYLRLQNVRSFALSEDYAVGPSASVELRFAQNLVKASQPFVEAIAGAGYNFYFRKNLLAISVSGVTRHQAGLEEEGPWVNNSLSASVVNASPPLWIGRLHAFAVVGVRSDDLDRGFYQFSGGVVRGYPTTNIFGRNFFRAGVEYRTRPINFYTLHVGAVAFYEGGSVWGSPTPTQPDSDFPLVYRHSVGLGIRGLFPQFDKETLRLDIGFPLEASGRGAFGTWISFSFGQAF